MSDALEAEVIPPERPTAFLESLRPSTLPKLAACPRFMGKGKAGAFAARGTLMDTAYRLLLEGKPEAVAFANLPVEDHGAVRWAVSMTRLFAGGSTILMKEKDCHITVPGLRNGGTADAILPDVQKLCDLKSGQLSDYTRQMAAYAYGCMEETFASKWTCHLFFCDSREIVTHHFTHEQAKAIVELAIEEAQDPEAEATPCEYCSWCAYANNCAARNRLATQSALAVSTAEGFTAILNEPAKLAAFLRGCKTLEAFQETAKEKARELMEAGTPLPGYKMQSRVGNEFVSPHDAARHLGFPELAGDFGQVFGDLSATKFKKAWAAKNGEDVLPPADAFFRAPTISFVAEVKEKKPKPEKKRKGNKGEPEPLAVGDAELHPHDLDS